MREYLSTYFVPILILLQISLSGIVSGTAYGGSVNVADLSPYPRSIEPLDTNTAAFIGTAPTGPVLKPTLVKSWSGYQAQFGNFDSRHDLSGAVYSYFQNGGSRVWIVRVGTSPSPLSKPRTVNQSEYLPRVVRAPLPDFASGLAPLEKIDGISLVAIPGQTDQQTQTALIRHCEKMLYRFAILDSTSSGGEPGSGSIQEQRSKLASAKGYAALYYPWINVQDPVSGAPVLIPPSGAVAGLYARNDRERGVQSAPVNIAVTGVTSLAAAISQTEQEALSFSGINVIRFFPGRGYLVWGDKTLTDNGYWKLINVRRLSSHIEESIYRGTQWTVFEPYGEALWARMSAVVGNFLNQVWVNGELRGAKPEEAYFVKCDRTTMTQSDIDARRLICLIGIAAVKPREFIILRISHQINQP